MDEEFYRKLESGRSINRRNHFVCLNDSDIDYLIASDAWRNLSLAYVAFDFVMSPCGQAPFHWRRFRDNAETPSDGLSSHRISLAGLRKLVSQPYVLSLWFGKNREGSYGSVLPKPSITTIQTEQIQCLAESLATIQSLRFSYCKFDSVGLGAILDIDGLEEVEFINTAVDRNWLELATAKKPSIRISRLSYAENGFYCEPVTDLVGD